MAIIIGKVESLKNLKNELDKRNITRFNSLGSINRFLDGFFEEKQKIIKFYENLIMEEIKKRTEEIKKKKIKVQIIKKK